MTTIVVHTKSVYGNTLIYPSNDIAVLACNLLKQKTLNVSQLQTLQAMGMEIQQTSGDERITLHGQVL